MINHLGFRVTDLEKTVEFYLKALAPLGYQKCMEFPGVQSIGVNGHPSIWFRQLTPEDTRGVVNSLHLAIQAKDTATVDAFYAAAIAAGGKCNGPPGPRPQYTKSYYGAFVFDPDGNNLETMFMDATFDVESKETAEASKASTT